MATKKLMIHIDDKPVEITIGTARKVDGIIRAERMAMAARMEQTDPLAMTAFYLYPTCTACVREPLWVRDMPVRDFAEKIDEADIDMWVKDAYELNSHWQTAMRLLSEIGAEEEKKTGTPLSGSMPPTGEPIPSQETSQPLKS